MGAVLLFGGLIACIYIALKTHHLAGLSLQPTRPEEEGRRREEPREVEEGGNE